MRPSTTAVLAIVMLAAMVLVARREIARSTPLTLRASQAERTLNPPIAQPEDEAPSKGER